MKKQRQQLLILKVLEKFKAKKQSEQENSYTQTRLEISFFKAVATYLKRKYFNIFATLKNCSYHWSRVIFSPFSLVNNGYGFSDFRDLSFLIQTDNELTEWHASHVWHSPTLLS